MKPDNRILIVKLSSLGDLFHALPAVHSIRRHLNAKVDWVTQPEYQRLVDCFDDVDRVILFHRRAAFRGMKPFLHELRAKSYDIVIDLQGLLKSAMIAAAARAERTLGPSYHREGSRILYSSVAGIRDGERHAVEQALDSARFLGAPDGEIKFPVVFPGADIEGTHPRILFFPCSRWPAKNWPVERFVELGRRLAAERGASLYVAGGPEDESVCSEIAGSIGEAQNLCGTTSLPELGGVIREMDLVVSVDTGPMHMAVAVGTPVVAIFGPTRPEKTGPYGTPHRVVRAASGSGMQSWRSAGSAMIREVNIEPVVEEVFRLLDRA